MRSSSARPSRPFASASGPADLLPTPALPGSGETVGGAPAALSARFARAPVRGQCYSGRPRATRGARGASLEVGHAAARVPDAALRFLPILLAPERGEVEVVVR